MSEIFKTLRGTFHLSQTRLKKLIYNVDSSYTTSAQAIQQVADSSGSVLVQVDMKTNYEDQPTLSYTIQEKPCCYLTSSGVHIPSVSALYFDNDRWRIGVDPHTNNLKLDYRENSSSDYITQTRYLHS
jgi:hypothetical protein